MYVVDSSVLIYIPSWTFLMAHHRQFPKLSFHGEMVFTRTRQPLPWCCRMWHEILWLMGHHGESRDTNIERRYNSEEHYSSVIFVEFQCVWTRDCAYLVYLIPFLESGSLGFTRFVERFCETSWDMQCFRHLSSGCWHSTPSSLLWSLHKWISKEIYEEMTLIVRWLRV